ncbi:alpha/beta fold hydrolase [Actinomadura roseirufa]|uniref:alpha/beta fold hydrolase n=1 Tax=Actinomadura roseirufa TaxID=2094049 RepID=UPI0013F15CF0|nr:alpha/beta fold hydrolase [Actinomadura roseirufa]
MSETPVTVVLVHGAWHGAWSFERLTPLLRDAGVPCAAVELPFTSYTDDVAAARSVIESVPGPVLLVGHSYGGSVISAAGDRPNVRELMFVAGKVAPAGGPQDLEASDLPPGHASVLTPELIDAILPEADATTVDPGRAHDLFYNDCPPEDSAAAVRRLRPVSTRCAEGGPDVAAWEKLPATYVVCALDRAIPPAVQEAYAARLGVTPMVLPTSHSPFWSRPRLLAERIVHRTRSRQEVTGR